MRGLGLAALSVLLISCAMGPDYSRPDIPTSDSFRMAEEQKDLPSLANAPWWELYHDEELQKLIRIALEENKDLKRAVATVDEFAARVLVTQNRLCPSDERDGQRAGFRQYKEYCLPRVSQSVQLLCTGESRLGNGYLGTHPPLK